MTEAAVNSNPAPTSAAPGPHLEAGVRLFVVHAPDDAWFVEGFLLPALQLPPGQVLLSSQLEPGAPIVDQIARGALSPVTVAVMSPAFLASPWTRLASRLALLQRIDPAGPAGPAGHAGPAGSAGPAGHDVAGGGSKLVPAILADCELSLLERSLVPLDFRAGARSRWEEEAAKLRKLLAVEAPPDAPLPCPYPGMRPFTTADASRLYGRDKEITELLGRLRDGQRELYVIGPSGSGKSSLVAAGVVPRMSRSPELAGGSFVVCQLRPGVDPAGALAGGLDATAAERGDATMAWLGDAVGRKLAGRADSDRLLLFIDQLEEMFAAPRDARDAWIAGLRRLRGIARVVLLLALRADYYASLMESALWADLGGQLSRLDVGPLRDAQLRSAIVEPARALGVSIEPVLVERLLRDVSDELGALPLLQDTLVDLWQQRARGLLRLAEYDAMSDGARTGLAVTVARRADSTLTELSQAQRNVARRVMLRLVQFGDGAAPSRRQQPRSALASAGDAADEIDAVIHHLADRRLITTSGGDAADPSPRIDLAHDILLSAWPTLSGWIQTRKDDEQHRRILESKAAEWVASGRGRWRLLDEDALREARRWLGHDVARDLGVSENLQGLLDHSEAALAADRRRRRLAMALVVAGLLAAVVVVSALALRAREQAQLADAESRRARFQLARNLVKDAAKLLIDDQPAQAAPYLLAAREAGLDDLALRAMFRWARQGLPRLVVAHHAAVTAIAWSPDGTQLATASRDHSAQRWDARTGQALAPPLIHRSDVRAVAWSPDGQRLATASNDRTARIWDAHTGLLVAAIDHDDRVTAVAWSPDGARIATTSEGPRAVGVARVWDARTGRPMTPALLHERQILAMAWSSDGTRLATGGMDKTARIWDSSRGEPITAPIAHPQSVRALAWSPDGKRLATVGDDAAQIWDPSTGAALMSLAQEPSVQLLAWSPQGSRVATADDGRTARIWNASTGQAMTTLAGHRDRMTALAWSPDGRWIATASNDHTVRVWDADTAELAMPPLGHRGQIAALAWSPDGRYIAVASDDGTARVWDSGIDRQVMPPLVHAKTIWAIAWSPDGKRLATASADATAAVWDAHSGARIATVEHERAVNAVAWSPDGHAVATGADDLAIQVWNSTSGQLIAPPLATDNWATALAWNPTGARIAAAYARGSAQVWDVKTGRAEWALGHGNNERLRDVAWSPDGTRLATASEDDTARIWDTSNGQTVTPAIQHRGAVAAIAWSPDGTRLATASEDNTAQIWNARTGLGVTPPFAHADKVYKVVWSREGGRLATASADHTARLWNAISGQPIVPPLRHRDAVLDVAWSPDGRWVATASRDHTARVWDASTGQAVSPAFTHVDGLTAVRWRPDGAALATASKDGTARVWRFSWDTGTLDDWRAAVARGDYRLNDAGVLITRSELAHDTPPSTVPESGS